MDQRDQRVRTLVILGRFAGIDEIASGLERTDVPIVAGVLTVIEFVADESAYVDSVQDSVSTVIRAVAGDWLIVAGMVRAQRGWRACRRRLQRA